MAFVIPAKGNKQLEELAKRIDRSKRVQALYKASNVMLVSRMNYSDHGYVHVKIVANAALKILRTLVDAGIEPSIVKDYGMKNEDAEIVVFLGACLHDIGNAVDRDRHDETGAFIAYDVMAELLKGYGKEKKEIIRTEVMHCIVAHDHLKPSTVEAGVVKIADALDMAEGRARIPYEAGTVGIHAISANAIEKVEVHAGKRERPINIKVLMENPAGVFQMDELLKKKIMRSGLEKYIMVTGEVRGEEGHLKKFELEF